MDNTESGPYQDYDGGAGWQWMLEGGVGIITLVRILWSMI
jgi:hypothetical protein